MFKVEESSVCVMCKYNGEKERDTENKIWVKESS